ncbi:MAG: PD-(D/E)XK nuclease family protein [Gammaproteobacteria bacterium]|nr:MAG: PD-(D/E)XK nuclease family protein [Gammaproteobacteria bacterium]
MTISSPDLPGQVLDYDALFNRLQAGHTLITGNSRLSRVLSGQYSQWRLDKGDRQWQSPTIVSWNLWLDDLWETASLYGITGTDRAVPGSRQLTSLWESTLKNTPVSHNLLHPESLANQLRDTRRLMVEWQLSTKDAAWFGDDNENYAAFYRWNKAFEALCEKGNWIAPEDRTALLSKAIREPQLPLPGNIDLLGFDEFNPARVKLLSALLESGTSVSNLSISSRQNAAVVWKSKDNKTELEQMARWVRYWFEKEPQSSIAVVVPDLQTRRQETERQLAEILTPGSDPGAQQAKPWNISMGTPLARVPMIEAAFDLLKLLDSRIDIQDIGRVLRSPWLRGGVTERNSRALLEKCLRDKYPRQLKLETVQYRSREIRTHDHHRNELPANQHAPQPWNSPELTTVLNRLIRFAGDTRGRQPASTWAEAFDQLLAGLGWPLAMDNSNQNQHSDNWQTLQAWRDGLRELASLDATKPRLGRKAAISQLQQICREKIFQPHTPTAAIQVLGLYEVNGLRFDHLWVVGLHNDNWPPATKPNPFIPGKLQRASGLPNSSPQRELEVASTITRRLLETAPDCVFSYPGQVDGEEVFPSTLISAVTTEMEDSLPAWQGENWRSTVAKADQPRIDPLVMPGKLQHVTAKGGSSILKHQALCPFRAFASNRLGADGLETPADGISPMLHGSLVHSVLENFWKETKTQTALLALDDAKLNARVHRHVGDVVKEEPGLRQRPAFSSVEANRLHRHVMAYLELEKERDSFEVIGFEKEILQEIDGQTIRLFIDRVDKLPSGEEIIIDYKTGKVEPKKWFDDRPEDPQLPLYAISAEKPPAAVVFGIVRDDGCLYKGVVKRGGLLPDLPPKETKSNQYLIDAGQKMPETIEDWRQILHRLMADFLAGEAAIDPKRSLKTCEDSYCELQSLCRVGELLQRKKNNQESAA